MAGGCCSESRVRQACRCSAGEGEPIKATTASGCCETERNPESCKPAAACCGGAAKRDMPAPDARDARCATRMPAQSGCC
jgi:hypothetical protein